MRLNIKKTIALCLAVAAAFSVSGCGFSAKTVASAMKFGTGTAEGMVSITSSSPAVPVAGDQKHIAYISPKGNVICLDVAAKTEKVLANAPSSGKYSSVALSGGTVYYRQPGGGSQWDTLFAADIASGASQKLGRIYMDSPVYVENGEVYTSETLPQKLKTGIGTNTKDYFFDPYSDFMVCDKKVYQQTEGAVNVFETGSEWRAKILCDRDTKLFFSDQNKIYYLQNQAFGTVDNLQLKKTLDLEDFDTSCGYINVQMAGQYVVIGNDSDVAIYDQDKNTRAAVFDASGTGPYRVNGELVFHYDEDYGSPIPGCFTEIGGGYYALDVEKTVKNAAQ